MVKQRVKKVVLYHETSYMSLKMGKAVVISLANLKNQGKCFFWMNHVTNSARDYLSTFSWKKTGQISGWKWL